MNPHPFASPLRWKGGGGGCGWLDPTEGPVPVRRRHTPWPNRIPAPFPGTVTKQYPSSRAHPQNNAVAPTGPKACVVYVTFCLPLYNTLLRLVSERMYANSESAIMAGSPVLLSIRLGPDLPLDGVHVDQTVAGQQRARTLPVLFTKRHGPSGLLVVLIAWRVDSTEAVLVLLGLRALLPRCARSARAVPSEW